MTPTSANCSASVAIGDEARRVGADDEPGQQVADDRRQAQTLCQIAADERGDEGAGEREDEEEVETGHAALSVRHT